MPFQVPSIFAKILPLSSDRMGELPLLRVRDR